MTGLHSVSSDHCHITQCKYITKHNTYSIRAHLSLPQFMLQVRLLVTVYSSWRPQGSSHEICGRQSVTSCSLLFPPANYYSTDASWLYINICYYSRPICSWSVKRLITTGTVTGMRNIDDLVSMSAACRERVNPYLFNYALSVAILHRPDTRNLQVPPLLEAFPDKFVDGAIFNKARRESEIFPSGSRVCSRFNWVSHFSDIFYMLWGRVGMLLCLCVSLSL